ncbi:MAG TPA: GGDEF domain-containing response regulator [Gammaproteobacteria bacterium]|nr:GGDEF domain-containing response regulator [Gammaproteobacteria bacterium]
MTQDRRHSPVSAPQSLRILHVEDDMIDTRMVRKILSAIPVYSVDCDHAPSINTALASLKHQDYDIILLDMRLPDGFGLELIKAVKEIAPEKPIVILSGVDDMDLTLKAVQYGAQEYLVKDELNSNILMRSIRYAIDHKQRELELAYLSEHDELTRIPNRHALKTRLRRAAVRCRQHNTMAALMFIDLDYFKIVNDTFGHSTGDLLLQQVAKRLHQCVRHDDTVARMGGDEFAVLLEGIRGKEVVTAIARKILKSLAEAFLLNSNEVYITASIGIYLYDGLEAVDLENIIRYSDKAMYGVKTGGRNGFKYFGD